MENARYFMQFHNSKFTFVHNHPIYDFEPERKIYRINLYRTSLYPYEIPCFSFDRGGKTMYFMVDSSPLNSDEPEWVLASDFFESLRGNLIYTPAEQTGEKAGEMGINMLHVGTGVLGGTSHTNLHHKIYELNRPRDFICTK